MTSEDWKTVLLALITTGGGLFATFAAVWLEWLRRKSNVAKETAAAAVDKAQAASDVAHSTNRLVNGRMDELLESAQKKAYAEGFAAGTAKVMAAVAESPKVSLDAQGVAQAVAQAVADSVNKPLGELKR